MAPTASKKKPALQTLKWTKIRFLHGRHYCMLWGRGDLWELARYEQPFLELKYLGMRWWSDPTQDYMYDPV